MPLGGGVIFRPTRMKIRRLKIENFRGIVDETIDFDPSFTVFAGRNWRREIHDIGGDSHNAVEAFREDVRQRGDCASLGGRDITYGKKSCLLRLTLSSPEDSITLSLGLDSDGNEMEDSAAADACAAKLRGVFAKSAIPTASCLYSPTTARTGTRRGSARRARRREWTE